MTASCANMMGGKNAPLDEVTDHGGSLARAERLFPDAPKPWLDLSTGINPHPYPTGDVPASAFSRLPEEARLRELTAAAAYAYGAPSHDLVVAAPGTQILLPLTASLIPPGRAAIWSPTYAEHRRAAALAGHAVSECADLDQLAAADLAIVVNPNNPDGRLHERAPLLDLAAHLDRQGGLLVVDEAFMDVGPADASLVAEAERGGFVVLRSFGKFFGLAGLRLGFAIGPHGLVERLRARLGPWAVSGPALEIGIAALSDLQWQAEMRARLAGAAAQLDARLARAGLSAAGGTDLYRFLRTPDAADIFAHLGRHGILVRSFAHDRQALRFGLPGGDEAFERLARALAAWRGNARR